jgi:hypothetical protein
MSPYSSDPIKKQAAAFVDMLVSGELRSSVDRLQEGSSIFGLSTEKDIWTGGAAYVFTTPSDFPPMYVTGRYGGASTVEIAWPASAIFRKTSVMSNKYDSYGKRYENKDLYDGASVDSHEFMVRGALPFDEAIVTIWPSLYPSVIAELARRGIKKIGKKSVHDIIQIAGAGKVEEYGMNFAALKESQQYVDMIVADSDINEVDFHEYVEPFRELMTMEHQSGLSLSQSAFYANAPSGSKILGLVIDTGKFSFKNPNSLAGQSLIVRTSDGLYAIYNPDGSITEVGDPYLGIELDDFEEYIFRLRDKISYGTGDKSNLVMQIDSRENSPVGDEAIINKANEIVKSTEGKKNLYSFTTSVFDLIDLYNLPMTVETRQYLIGLIKKMQSAYYGELGVVSTPNDYRTI